jgi:hypothetical protein
MMNCIKSSVVLLLVTGVLTTVARAQDRQATSDTETGTERVGSDADFHLLAQKPKVRYELQPGEDPQNKLGLPFLKHLAADQKK